MGSFIRAIFLCHWPLAKPRDERLRDFMLPRWQADDVTTAMLLNPVAEIEHLRVRKLATERGVKLGGGAYYNVDSASGTHLDIVVTFKGLGGLPPAGYAAFQPTVTVFAGAGGSGYAVR